jgi:immune inhibitor A
VAVLAAAVLPATGSAAPADDTTPAQASQHRPDNRPGPLTKAQQDLRKAALEKLVKGQAKLESIDGSTVLEVDANKYVEFPVEKTEQVFTVLAEFGDQGNGLSSYGASQQLVVLEDALGVRDEITTFDNPAS